MEIIKFETIMTFQEFDSMHIFDTLRDLMLSYGVW